MFRYFPRVVQPFSWLFPSVTHHLIYTFFVPVTLAGSTLSRSAVAHAGQCWQVSPHLWPKWPKCASECKFLLNENGHILFKTFWRNSGIRPFLWPFSSVIFLSFMSLLWTCPRWEWEWLSAVFFHKKGEPLRLKGSKIGLSAQYLTNLIE